MEDLEARIGLIELMHKLYTEDFDDLLHKIENLLYWQEKDLETEFEEFLQTMVDFASLNCQLPQVSSQEPFLPSIGKISLPKTNKPLDVAEVALRVPQAIEKMACLAIVHQQMEAELKRLRVLGDVVYRYSANTVSLQGGFQYFSLSFKTRAGEGERAVNAFLDLFGKVEIR